MAKRLATSHLDWMSTVEADTGAAVGGGIAAERDEEMRRGRRPCLRTHALTIKT
jgi:hypothetical protein